MMACIYFENKTKQNKQKNPFQIYFWYLYEEEEGEENFSFTVIAYRDFSLLTPLVGTTFRILM